MLRLARIAATALAAQQGHLFPWVPVAFATGIGLYFGLPVEPGARQVIAVALAAVAAALIAARLGAGAAPFVWAVALIGGGLCTAAVRTAHVSAPVIGFRYYGPVEGRIVGIDRSASDALRLTLDQVLLERVAPDRLPERVRISLHGAQDWLDPRPGAIVMTTAHLSPPGGPVEPGGFDFRRHSWFARLGGVGYTRTPVLELAPPDPGAARLLTWRRALGARVKAALPDETGAFAAAVMTGDRSDMGQATLDALRRSNLAHLLAISGLHMGLLAGFVFAAVRVGLAAWPQVALRLPTKKIAAGAALAAAACYLALSGGNVATERAFVMAAVALVAVLCDRRALSLRAVALAAMIVLALRPEALLGPGFQMSFSATVGLVAVFGALREAEFRGGRIKWLRPVLMLILSSAVAGAATAPVGAAHFNQVSRLGLLANLTSVPVMGVLVMPMAVVAACVMPLGLEALPLRVMALGLDWILTVARLVANWPGAVGQVPSPPSVVLPLVAYGGLILALCRGKLRLVGLAPVATALWLWSGADRPPILIAEEGGLVGVLTPAGRALSRDRGAGFVAGVWLENDGDPTDQPGAAARWTGDAGIRHVTGKRRSAELSGCDGAWLIVTNAPAPALPGCTILDATWLRQSGSVALWPMAGGAWRVDTTADHAGRRPWVPRRRGQDTVAPAMRIIASPGPARRPGTDMAEGPAQSSPTR